MGRGSFPERAAHLSYAAPLIALLLQRQVGHIGPGAVLVGAVLFGGLAAAATGWRAASGPQPIRSFPALFGALGNLAVAVWLWAS